MLFNPTEDRHCKLGILKTNFKHRQGEEARKGCSSRRWVDRRAKREERREQREERGEEREESREKREERGEERRDNLREKRSDKRGSTKYAKFLAPSGLGTSLPLGTAADLKCTGSFAPTNPVGSLLIVCASRPPPRPIGDLRRGGTHRPHLRRKGCFLEGQATNVEIEAGKLALSMVERLQRESSELPERLLDLPGAL